MKKLALHVFEKEVGRENDVASLSGLEKYFETLASPSFNEIMAFNPDILLVRETEDIIVKKFKDRLWGIASGVDFIYLCRCDRFFVQHELQKFRYNNPVIKKRGIRLDIYKPMDIPKEYDIIHVGSALYKEPAIIESIGRELNIKYRIVCNEEWYNMPMIYNKAKILTWGARDCIGENFGTLVNKATAEAVACGLPIIGFKNTFKDSYHIINGRNAILINTTEEMKLAIVSLLLDDNKRNLMGIESRKIAEENLDYNINHVEFLHKFFNGGINGI